MSNIKKFMDVTVGEKFKTSVNGGPVSEYVKVQEERISCCVALNAALIADPNQKVQITPLVEVELIDNPKS